MTIIIHSIPRTREWLPAVFLAFLSTNPLAASQIVGGQIEVLHTHSGAEFGQLGNAACGPGDLNGDGIADYVIASHFRNVGVGSRTGRVTAFSGADHSEIWHKNGQNSDDKFGHAVTTIGDLNDDGIDDIVVSAIGFDWVPQMDNGRAYALSGADGSIIWTYTSPTDSRNFGMSLASAGDINGDGYEEVVAGMPNADDGSTLECGKISILDGRTGSFLRDIYGGIAYNHVGASVAGIGDQNGDGYPDIAVGVPGRDFTSLNNAGRVVVLSGKSMESGTGNPYITIINGSQDGSEMGTSIASVGDLDGDGIQEFVVGAPYSDVGSTVTKAGRVYVFGGGSFSYKAIFYGTNDDDNFGMTVAAGGDVDSDGIPDILIGAPGFGGGSTTDKGAAYAYSGSRGILIQQWEGDVGGAKLGSSLAAIGDLNGDGTTEFVAGAPTSDRYLTWQGEALVCSLNPFIHASKSLASVYGDTVEYQIAFPNIYAGEEYRFLVSLSGYGPALVDTIMVPLTIDHMFTLTEDCMHPNIISGGCGLLDGNAEGLTVLSYGSLGAHFIGMKAFCATVVYTGATPTATASSILQVIEFTP